MAPLLSALRSNREFELLLLCSRSRLSGQEVQSLRQRLASGIDWEDVMALGRRHRILPLFHATLEQYAWQEVPEPYRRRLRRRAERNRRKALLLTAALVQIRKRLENAGIPMVSFKGPTLAALLYDNVGLRFAGDLDILVARSDVPRARRLLHSMGYLLTGTAGGRRVERLESTRLHINQDYDLRHRERPVRVELHWRFGKNALHTPLPVETALRNRQPVAIGDNLLPTLAPVEDLLAYLCFHGTNHQWFRLFWLSDIAELIRWFGGGVDWDGLFARARRHGNYRAVSLGLLLASELFDVPLPEPAQRGVQRSFPPFVMRYIERSILGRVAVEEGDILYRELLKPRYVLYFATTARYRLNYLFQYLFYPPNPLVDSIALPWKRWLVPLYLPIKIGYVIHQSAVRPLFRKLQGGTALPTKGGEA